MSDEIDILPASALGVLSRAEVDMQIATAKQYPRSIKQFQHDAKDLATLDQATAQSCYYSLPRRQFDKETKRWVTKMIEGGSIRLAEIVAVTYGNLRCGARIVDEGSRFVTAQGVAFDMQRNLFMTSETKRRITTSKGERFSDDMIAVTANAACSIALRNAIFRVVPGALVKPILEEAKRVALGETKSLEESRSAALAHFEKLGAETAQVLAMLDRHGVEDVTIDDVVTLRGLATAIKDGEITLEEALQPPSEPVSNGRRPSARTVEPPPLIVEPPQPNEPAANDPETVVTLDPNTPLPGDDEAP